MSCDKCGCDPMTMFVVNDLVNKKKTYLCPKCYANKEVKDEKIDCSCCECAGDGVCDQCPFNELYP